MSLFKNQLTAAREKRVEVDLQTEDSVATESLGEEVTQDVDIDSIIDQFAEDRDRLNAMLEEPATEALEAEVTAEAEEQVVAEVEQVEEIQQVEVEAEVSQEAEVEVSQEVVEEPTQEEAPVEQAEQVVVEDTTEVVAEEEKPEDPTEENEDLPEDAVPATDDTEEEIEEDETMVAELAILEEIENDVFMIEQDSREISMIADSIVAIESFGINPSAIAILQTTGLLSGTVLDAVGVESLGYAGPKDDQTMIALEALEAKAEEKSAGWSAKIMSMAKSVGSKIMSVLGGIWEKITGSVKAIGSYTWDKAKAAGAVVKAHPYKTILAVVVAIAAVAGITVFISGGLPALAASSKTGDVVNKFVKFSETIASKVNAIKWPFGKVAAEATDKGKLLLTYSEGAKGVAWANVAPEATTLGKMGWTSTVVKGVESSLGRAWSGIKTGAEAFGSSTSSYAKTFAAATFDSGMKVNEGIINAQKGVKGIFNAKAAGTNFGIVAAAGLTVGVIKFVYGLVFKVVAFGLRVIYNTMKAIANAVKGSSTAAA